MASDERTTREYEELDEQYTTATVSHCISLIQTALIFRDAWVVWSAATENKLDSMAIIKALGVVAICLGLQLIKQYDQQESQGLFHETGVVEE